jgi:hypothetical protein
MRHTNTLFVVLILLSCYSYAESGSEAWLGYARLDPSVSAQYASLPSTLVAMDESAVLKSAQTELARNPGNAWPGPCGSKRNCHTNL